MKVTTVIVAGGKGRRMGAGINKVFLKLCGREIIARTVEAFEKNPRIDEIVVVTGAEDIDAAAKILAEYGKVTAIVAGGAERRQSVLNGLGSASGDIVLIHDGARAFISGDEIDRVIDDCVTYGAAAVGVTCKDTLKTADENRIITGTIDREKTYLIQTPQAFDTKIIRELHKKAEADGLEVTDDCAVAEHYGVNVKITAGSYDNIKLTTPEDMAIGEMILKRHAKELP